MAHSREAKSMAGSPSSYDLTPKVLASDYIDARLDAITKDNPLISGRIRNLLLQCGDPPPAEPINCDMDPTASGTDVEREEATPEDGSDPEQEQEPGHEKKTYRVSLPQCHGSDCIRLQPNEQRHAASQRSHDSRMWRERPNDNISVRLRLDDISLGDSPGSCELDEANSTKLEEIGSNKYFHVTVDNIDITHHVNDQQLDRRTSRFIELLVTPTFRTGILPALTTFEPTLHIKRLYRESISSISSQLPNPTRHIKPG